MRFRLLIAILILAFVSLSFAVQADAPKKATPAKADSDKSKTAATPAKAEDKSKAKKDDKADAAKKDEKAAEKPEKPKDPLTSSGTYGALKFRSIGPAMVSGRISSLAVDPKNRAHYFVGVASGGVWHTDNGGTTFTPVFDGEGSYSIGAVTLDPKDSNVVWVGTGENNSQRSVSYGDGVYKSNDGGKSWNNVGLKKSEHIGRIAIDPRDSNVVYVAAQGPLWSAGGDRGLYKTTDGGKTWKAVLTISENTGVSDVVIDPSNPDTLYASAYQRRRHVWTMIDGGPESGIYKSTDAGTTWNKMKSGLPSEDMGKIGLAIAPSNPDVIYATVEAANRKGGIFRSTDRGATWDKRNDYDQGAMYYSNINVDPKISDRIYVMGTLVQTSDDGGKTLRRMTERYKHVDTHVYWIDPNDTDYILTGCDGGVYESFDRGAAWRWKSNLPLSQFYDVAIDTSKPFYYVYGGTQDNNSVGGPSRTRSLSGITNADWFITQGGDGFRSQIDPEDANTVYSESQYGGLNRYDRASGQHFGIQPEPGKGEPALRWNWDSPLIISPFSHTRLYFAANRLFRSDDRGDTWKPISPDLTRQIDRDTLPVMGKLWGPDAVAKHTSTSFYGNIVSLHESPKKEGVIYVGTDDGLIQVTENGGGNWRKIETFPGVPDRTYVSRILASQHADRTVYASFDNHKNGDFKPYILKSTDAGGSWTSIAANLPENGPVLAIAEDFVNPNLLFAGTEYGLWFTLNGGGTWTQMKAGLPTIAIRDAVIHKGMNDIVLASYGRGFYVLDDYSALRGLTADQLNQAAFIAPSRDTMMYIETMPYGGRGKASNGEDFYTADNPPYGATFTYYLKDKFKSLKEKRQDAEKEAAKKNNGAAYPALKYPTKEEMRAEAEEEAPSVWLTITDEGGNIVRRVPASNSSGFNRTTWNLRYPPVELPPDRGGDEIFPWEFGAVGPLVMPGKYTAKLSAKVQGKWQDLGGPQTVTVYVDGADKMADADRKALHDFQWKVSRLDRAVSSAISAGNELGGKVRGLRRALADTPADTNALMARVDAVDVQLRPIMVALRGDRIQAQRQEPVPPSINDRINNIEGDERFSTAKPSQTHLDDYQIAHDEFAGQLDKLHKLLDETSTIEKEMEKIGAPWTPGRAPEWDGKLPMPTEDQDDE
jgi:photosystem II stability/assembly factor-like uncharacterized protein